MLSSNRDIARDVRARWQDYGNMRMHSYCCRNTSSTMNIRLLNKPPIMNENLIPFKIINFSVRYTFSAKIGTHYLSNMTDLNSTLIHTFLPEKHGIFLIKLFLSTHDKKKKSALTPVLFIQGLGKAPWFTYWHVWMHKNKMFCET